MNIIDGTGEVKNQQLANTKTLEEMNAKIKKKLDEKFSKLKKIEWDENHEIQ